MGFCASQPLQKVAGTVQANDNDESNDSTWDRTASRKSSRSFISKLGNSTHSSSNYISLDLAPPWQYFSFRAFILQSNNPQIFEWLFLDEICKCSTSQLYLVKNVHSELLFAAKVYSNAMLHRETIRNEDPPIDCLNREIKIMSTITHPNVMSFHEMIEDVPTNSTILIIPYATLGSLDDAMQGQNPLSYENLLICMYQIAEAMAFMHSKNVSHRDIKPRNILAFTENYYAVTSFSMSTILDDENDMYTDIKGTIEFLSPEEVAQNPYKLKKTDVWSFGVTFYYLFFKQMPFKISEFMKKNNPLTLPIMESIFKENELTFPDRPSVDSAVKDALKRILKKDPEERPNFSDITSYDIFSKAKEIQINEIYVENNLPKYDGVESIVYDSSTLSLKKDSE
jgi:serine/threonine protein kinase